VHVKLQVLGRSKNQLATLIRSDRIDWVRTARVAGRPIRMARSAGPLLTFFSFFSLAFLLVVCLDGLQN
jgi:uncharacterized membrane protein